MKILLGAFLGGTLGLSLGLLCALDREKFAKLIISLNNNNDMRKLIRIMAGKK